MQSHGGGGAGEAIDLGCVGEFLFDVEAGAACTNLPKRVPVLAKPQEGISIWNESRPEQPGRR